MKDNRMIRFSMVALLGATVACASAGQPVTPAPEPVAVTQEPAPAATQQRFDLTPPDAAVRAADRVTLTGRELGTMWTFENLPLEAWQEQYGFWPSPEWLENVRLSSLRFGTYCSASFVSPDGLVLTNHHCARTCVEQQSSAGTDHVVAGFYAPTRARERLCDELFLDQLVAIEEVTDKVQAAAPQGAGDTQLAAAIADAAERIEEECGERTGNTCQVVDLFQGGQYQLYQYKRYQPVKLVFAPELQAGFFGGDPDNFTYPRYALDVSFVRAYGPDGQPVRTPNHFRWRAEGAAEDEVVFVTGNPGSTARLTTVAQIMYERMYRHPFLVRLTSSQRDLLAAYAAAEPGMEAELRQDLFEVENTLKSYSGQLAGLRDSVLVGTKISWEREFRAKIDADPAARAQFGDVWQRIADIQRQKLEVSPPLNVANAQGLIGAPHLGIAAQLVTYVRQMALPEAERDAQFRMRAPQIRSILEAPTPFPPELARLMLRAHLDVAHTWLAPDDTLRRLLLQPGEDPDAATARLISFSRILDPAFRSGILNGGPSALETSTDPLIVFARTARDVWTTLNVRWQQIQAAETVQKQRLAKALFAAYGTSLPPDATFTLRISDGRVRRYEYNGTFAPPVTTYYGMYGRAAEFNNEMPWTLPDAFQRAAKTINLATPLNFVSTTDITGGNSGSPMIDREGRIVGLVFDGNIEQLPNEFLFRDAAGRTISVHSAGILEALRSVYGATALLRELLGQTGVGGGRQ